jgi:hypothetical protein
MRPFLHCQPAINRSAAGCALVTTHVTPLAARNTPTQNVVLLFDYPSQPRVKIALIEVQGMPAAAKRN